MICILLLQTVCLYFLVVLLPIWSLSTCFCLNKTTVYLLVLLLYIHTPLPLAQLYWFLFGSLILLFCAGFLGRYFSLSFYPINMKFGHDIPRVVSYTVTFLSRPPCSSRFIWDFLDHYVLESPKAVSAYL